MYTTDVDDGLTEEQHTETKKLLCRFAFFDG
jgi:hypothetical protein